MQNKIILILVSIYILTMTIACQKSEQQNKKNQLLSKKAIELFKQQKFNEAIEIYNKLIEKNPEQYLYYSNKASAYVGLKDYDNAISTLEQIFKFKPKFAEGYVGIAIFYHKKGDNEKSIEYLKKAIPLYDERIKNEKFFDNSIEQKSLILMELEGKEKAISFLKDSIKKYTDKDLHSTKEILNKLENNKLGKDFSLFNF